MMLQSSTLRFIRQLSRNNNKEWFEKHRKQYEDARMDFEQLVTAIIQRFGNIDPDVAPLTARQCIYRQYRDVRFSKDKTPYKPHMGASLDRDGKNSGFAGYYFHLEPGNKSMLGGGIWMPEAVSLKKIRQEIDYNWDEFSSIIQNKDFRRTFGDLETGEYKLSREPKGYTKENPAIEYLKLKSLVAMQPLTDDELTSKGIVEKVVKGYTALMPLVHFVNRSLE